jgi:hypothetical protein
MTSWRHKRGQEGELEKEKGYIHQGRTTVDEAYEEGMGVGGEER